jgi:hypothetical protein
LCTGRFSYCTCTLLLLWPSVSLARCSLGLRVSRHYFSVARMYSEAPFFLNLLCPRFTVPEYYCSRARLRLRLAYVAKWHRSSPPHGSSAEDCIPSRDTVRYSAPVAAHGSAGTSRYLRFSARTRISCRQGVQRRVARSPRASTYRVVSSTWHAPSVSDTVQRTARLAGPNTVASNGRPTAVSAQPWPLLAHPHPHPPSLPHPA